MFLTNLARDRGHAEIGDARTAAAVDHHVVRLQIAMQHARVVRGGHARAQLPRDLERLVRRQPPDATQQRRQILSIDELHREELESVDVADVMDAADVRMRDLPRDARFGMKPRQRARRHGKRLRQELQRHRLIELQVVGLVDFAHPADAEQADDAVAVRENSAGDETSAGPAVRNVRRAEGGRRGPRGVCAQGVAESYVGSCRA